MAAWEQVDTMGRAGKASRVYATLVPAICTRTRRETVRPVGRFSGATAVHSIRAMPFYLTYFVFRLHYNS